MEAVVVADGTLGAEDHIRALMSTYCRPVEAVLACGILGRADHNRNRSNMEYMPK